MKSKMLMEAIGDIDGRFINEAEPVPKPSRATKNERKLPHVWRFAPLAACLVVVVAMVTLFGNNGWFINGNAPRTELNNGDGTTNSFWPNQTDTPNNQAVPIKMYLVVNELSGVPNALTNDIALLWDDATAKTPDELQAYYGTEIYPTKLPESFRKGMIVDESSYGYFWVFKRADGTIYYDQNTILYESEAAAVSHEQQGFRDMTLPSLTVTLSKERAIYWDVLYMEMMNSTPTKSDIGGNEVTILKYSDTGGEHFIGYFVKDGVNFEIQGNMITQNEFVDVLAGYFITETN